MEIFLFFVFSMGQTSGLFLNEKFSLSFYIIHNKYGYM